MVTNVIDASRVANFVELAVLLEQFDFRMHWVTTETCNFRDLQGHIGALPCTEDGQNYTCSIRSVPLA